MTRKKRIPIENTRQPKIAYVIPNQIYQRYITVRAYENIIDNPTNITNPLYQELVKVDSEGDCELRYKRRSLLYGLHKRNNNEEGYPTWHFDQRAGMTTDILPDGRTLYIAGEHEDYYDPDFFIYNDVILRDKDTITIYTYPHDCFPPTDFHRTFVFGDTVWIIGSTGYKDYGTGTIQVCCLDIPTMRMSIIETRGDYKPPWMAFDDDDDIERMFEQILRDSSDSDIYTGRCNKTTRLRDIPNPDGISRINEDVCIVVENLISHHAWVLDTSIRTWYTLEEYTTICLHVEKARTIQTYWRECYYNPHYMICRRRITRQFNELVTFH